MEIKELGIHDIVTINNTKCIILAIEDGIIKCTPWEEYNGEDDKFLESSSLKNEPSGNTSKFLFAIEDYKGPDKIADRLWKS